MNPPSKQILFSVLFLIFLSLSFLALYLIFYSATTTFLSSLIFFLIVLCLLNAILFFFSLSFLKPFVCYNRKIKEDFIVFAIIFLGSFSVFLWFGFNIYSLLSFILFLALLFLSYHSIKKEQSKYLKFSFHKVFKSCKWFFLNGFAILIAFVAFLSPKILGGKIELPRSLYDVFFSDIEERLASQYPGFSGEMTVDEFILLLSLQNPPKDSLIKKEEEEIKTYSDFKKFSKNLEKKVDKKEMDELLAQGRKELLKTFGFNKTKIKIEGDEKMSDFFYKISYNWLETKVKIYQYLVGVVAGLILFFFFSARLVLFIAGIFFLPLAWSLFKILRKINFFKVEIEKVNREKITI